MFIIFIHYTFEKDICMSRHIKKIENRALFFVLPFFEILDLGSFGKQYDAKEVLVLFKKLRNTIGKMGKKQYGPSRIFLY